MMICYRDELGLVTVEVNCYGIAFDQDNGNILFADENDKEYIVPVSAILEILPLATPPF